MEEFKYGDTLIIKKITKTEYLAKFYNPIKKTYCEAIYTRNDMKKLANNNKAFQQTGYFKLFTGGFIDKLEIKGN